MSDEGKKEKEVGMREGPWAWLTQTWVGQIISLIVLVTAPFAFIEARGFVWTCGIAAIATSFWWWTFRNASETPMLPGSQPRQKYSTKRIYLALFLPVSFWIIFVLLLFYDVSHLNIWRRDFPTTSVLPNRYGPTNKFFGDTAPRSTPEEREEYERAEWIRWMESGAQHATKKGDLL